MVNTINNEYNESNSSKATRREGNMSYQSLQIIQSMCLIQQT